MRKRKRKPRHRPAKAAKPARPVSRSVPPAAKDHFALDLQRCLAGASLAPEHFDAFSRLIKTLVHGAIFQFVLAEVRNQHLRDDLIRHVDQAVGPAGLHAVTLDLAGAAAPDTVQSLEEKLIELAREYPVIHLCGADQWLHAERHPRRWQELNIRRDAIAERCRARLVWWLPPEQIARCATEAPDLWSWRSGVYDFSCEPEMAPPTDARFAPPTDARFAPDFDARNLRERSRRVAQLRAWLEQEPPDDIRLRLLDELAEILFRLGELDEALRLRREEELPCYEKQGDERGGAVTWGKISNILLARNELDEAQRILREKVIPVFEKLGYMQEQAVAWVRIGDILFAQGNLDEALRILREKALPVLQETGDERDQSIVWDRIGDILFARGELDEALRILRKKILPIVEKLGDVLGQAATLSKTADILCARGELDEALRIQHEEVIPALEKLGDVQALLAVRANTASTLLARNRQADRNEARRLLELALADARRLQLTRESGQIETLLRQAR